MHEGVIKKARPRVGRWGSAGDCETAAEVWRGDGGDIVRRNSWGRHGVPGKITNRQVENDADSTI